MAQAQPPAGISVDPVRARVMAPPSHTGAPSQKGLTPDSLLHDCHLQIPNNPTFELVFVSRAQWDMEHEQRVRVCMQVTPVLNSGSHIPPTMPVHGIPVFPWCAGVQSDSVVHSRLRSIAPAA